MASLISFLKLVAAFVLFAANSYSHAQDIVVPKNIREFRLSNIKNEKKCNFESISIQDRETADLFNFYVSDPISSYSSIKSAQIKGAKLYINFIQKIELMQYEANVVIKEPKIDYSKVVDFGREVSCFNSMESSRELNTSKSKPTGSTKWFDESRPERLLLIGFDKIMPVSIDNPGWTKSGGIEIDLRSTIRASVKSSQVFTLSIRCVTCSGRKIELTEGMNPPVVEMDLQADFRFIKNQMERGLVE